MRARPSLLQDLFARQNHALESKSVLQDTFGGTEDAWSKGGDAFPPLHQRFLVGSGRIHLYPVTCSVPTNSSSGFGRIRCRVLLSSDLCAMDGEKEGSGDNLETISSPEMDIVTFGDLTCDVLQW